MATTGANNLGIIDIAKRLDPSGDTADVAEMLSQTNEIVQDIPWIEGNLPTGQQSTIRTGLPSTVWRKLYQGVPPSKSTTAQVADTIFIGRIPPNSRLTLDSQVSCAAGTASSTLSIGIRSTRTQVVISATAIASGVDVAAAGQKLANNGALIANGAEYVTTEWVDVFATVAGAAVAANQAMKFEVGYVTD